MLIHERFKELRKYLKMTQTEFGEQLGKTMRTIQEYERANRAITDGVLLNLQEKFNVNIDWMRTGEGSMFLEDSDKKMDSDIVNIAPAYDLPERFLQLAGKLKNSDIAKVEGYMQAIIDEYKNKDMQKLSS